MILARALERFASSYSWRSSRALTEENRPLFKRHIQGALTYLLENAELSGARPVSRTLSRDAYAASLCSHGITFVEQLRQGMLGVTERTFDDFLLSVNV